MLHDSTKSSGTCFSLKRFPGNCLKCFILELKLHAIQLKKLVILLCEGILRLLQNTDQRFFIQRIQGYHDRNSSDKLRDQTEFNKVLRHNLLQNLAHIAVFLLGNLRSETNGFGILSCLDNLLQSVKGTTANKQDVCSIDLDKFLMRMLSSSLRRYACNGSFQNFQKCLLYALTGHISGD